MYNGGGLGLAPAVAAAVVQIGTRLVGSLFGPTEQQQTYAAARAGNVVAWWRLKALAGKNLTAPQSLTAIEREALAVAMGPDALSEGGMATRQAAARHVQELYAAGIGAELDRMTAETLGAAPGGAGGLAVAGMDLKTLAVAGAVGLAAFALMRRGKGP